MAETPTDGLVIVDKPGGRTSHDVVGMLRRIAHTRKVGHAGTLDPMATGVLVLGIGKATRLLHHLVLADKTYDATIRLGVATITDDAEGESIFSASAAGLTEADVAAAMQQFRGSIDQVPSAVSAIKVGGERAYQRVRDGETVALPARPVVVSHFAATAWRHAGDVFDVDVTVTCSSGTYVRALARDLGAALGVGGHLTMLRRTRVGPFDLAEARTLEQLAALADPVTLPLPVAVRRAMPVRDVNDDEARALSYGKTISSAGLETTSAAIAPDGTVVALLTEAGGSARPVLVFTPAG